MWEYDVYHMEYNTYGRIWVLYIDYKTRMLHLV